MQHLSEDIKQKDAPGGERKPSESSVGDACAERDSLHSAKRVFPYKSFHSKFKEDFRSGVKLRNRECIEVNLIPADGSRWVVFAKVHSHSTGSVWKL